MYLKKAFTLIELLIVVAIIAILAAIAVPNFLEAQTRSKVSKVKADFRAISIGVESYAVDNQHYPPSAAPLGLVIGTEAFDWILFRLTTPIAYLSNVSFFDPFSNVERRRVEALTRPLYMYFYYFPIFPAEQFDWAANAIKGHFGGDMKAAHKAYILWSPGPNRRDDNLYWVDFVPWSGSVDTYMNITYDPTNGTVSNGDICRLGGEIRATGYRNN